MLSMALGVIIFRRKSPLNLDRNPRPKGGKTDMGAYESNINMNGIISIVNGNWESIST